MLLLNYSLEKFPKLRFHEEENVESAFNFHLESMSCLQNHKYNKKGGNPGLQGEH
jgi:hypothetical protein